MVTSAPRDEARLKELAALVDRRNEIDRAIAALVGRPAEKGHLGEYVAANIFDVELAASANARGADGRFTSGPLAGRTVNVKWFAAQQGILDLAPVDGPDYYLVLAGPRGAAGSSRGAERPLCIASVHLFDGTALVAALRARGCKVGTASSVRTGEWLSSMVFPDPVSPLLQLTTAQRELLTLFAPRG